MHCEYSLAYVFVRILILSNCVCFFVLLRLCVLIVFEVVFHLYSCSYFVCAFCICMCVFVYSSCSLILFDLCVCVSACVCVSVCVCECVHACACVRVFVLNL